VAHQETLRVRVPEGTPPGQRMRLAGKGHHRGGGDPGDLYVEVLVEGMSSGVGPLRVPLAQTGALPGRCFACGEQRDVERVPVRVRPRLDRTRGAMGLVIALFGGIGFERYEVATVDLPLCRRHRARFEEGAQARLWFGVLALMVAAGLCLDVLVKLLAWGALAALVCTMATMAVLAFVGRSLLKLADARDPFRVWLDAPARELVLPPVRADREG
jgi:hypothetical protein